MVAAAGAGAATAVMMAIGEEDKLSTSEHPILKRGARDEIIRGPSASST